MEITRTSGKTYFESGLFQVLLFFVICCFQSGLNISSQLSVFLFGGVLLLAVSLLLCYLSPVNILIDLKQTTKILIYAFTGIITYTMLARGIGFEMLGSGKSGGMFYIKLFLVLFIFVCSINVSISFNYIEKLFLFFWLSSLLPFFSDLVYLYFDEATLFNQLITGSSTIEFYAQNETTGLLRIQSATAVADCIAVITLIYFPLFDVNGGIKFTYSNVIMLSILVIMVGISGHRITFVGIFLLFLLYYYFKFGIKKLIRPVLLAIGFSIFCSILIIAQYENLPPSFQRSFSFLPFIPVSEITLEAGDSMNFRLFMAAKALLMLPEYYLLGKGFAFNNYNVNFEDYFGIIDFFAEIGVFHNGLLGLAVNLGIPGLFVGVLLIFSIIKECKIKSINKSDNRIGEILLVLKCKLLVVAIYFFLLYGDVQTNFIDLIVLASLFRFISAGAESYKLKAIV